MQPTTNEESSNTAMDSPSQPTREQEEYARGFSAALHRLYAQRGTPTAACIRLQSTPSDLDPTVLSKSTPALSAASSAGQSSSSAVVSSVACVSISSQSLPAAVRSMMTSADSQSASTTIPLCVTNLESNVSDDRLLDDEPPNQQPTCDRNSTDDRWNVLPTEGATTAAVDVEQQQKAAVSAAHVVDDDEKRRKNRSAARRCREKRLERQRVMRKQVDDVGAENLRLEAKIGRLRNRVEQLQSLLAEHRLGPCRLYGFDASTTTSLDTNTTLDFDELMMNDGDHE